MYWFDICSSECKVQQGVWEGDWLPVWINRSFFGIQLLPNSYTQWKLCGWSKHHSWSSQEAAAMDEVRATGKHVHVPRLTPPTLELYLHFWGMTTFVTLAVIITGNAGSILTTLSGMVEGVVPPAPAAVSTPHPCSAKNYPSPPPMTLRSGCALLAVLLMKTSQLKQLNSIFSKKALHLTIFCIHSTQ